jgi:hypothetical protein
VLRGGKSFGSAFRFDFINEQTEGARLALPGNPFPGYDPLAAYHYDVVLLSCDNCSMARLHRRSPIVEWRAANPPN